MIPSRPPWLYAALAFVVLLTSPGCAGQAERAPLARDGVLDLSSWDADRDGPVALDGQWEFHWDQLLTPEDFAQSAARPEPSGYLNLPGTWKGYLLKGAPLPGLGQATFRLRLLPGPGSRPLAIRLFALHAAYRLWIDGRLAAESGVVGRSETAETPNRSLVLARFESGDAPVELVLQVSNHSYRRGGPINPLLLGVEQQLEQIHLRIWSWGMLFVGSLLIMALYHFVLYFLKKKDVSTLYFSLVCLVLICAYMTLDLSDWLVLLILPEASSKMVDKYSLVFLSILPSILYRFYRSLYPREFFLLLQRICDIRNIAFIGIIMTQPGYVIYAALQWFAISTFVFNVCYLIMLGLCLRRGRDGALVLFLGYIFLSLTLVNNIYNKQVFSLNASTLLHLGLFAFVLSQALALAQRFTKAFTTVEHLSQALESNYAKLQTEMEERTRLEREIISVSEEERRRLSHDLHDGLCQQLAGTRIRCAALARRPISEQGVATEVRVITSLIEGAVSQAYDLSRGLWPVEHGPGDVGASLIELVRRLGRASGVNIEYSESLACAACRNEHLVQLFRIAQEALTNALKHASPGRIAVSLDCGPDRRLTLCVRDNGIGRKAAARTEGGFGLRIMAYRARMIQAALSLDDAEGGGTLVVCTLTCSPGPQTQGSANG